MSNRLVAFATPGNPNIDGLAEWQPGGKKALRLGDKDTTMGKPSSFKLWMTMLTNKAPGE